MAEHARVQDILAYHERTKHRLGAFARSLGYLDWETQPDPFRRYDGAPRVWLDPCPRDADPGPELGAALTEGAVPAASPSAATLSRLLYDALAISAWKQAGGSRWSLRCNPSSGNLHPTEGYLLAPALPGLGTQAAIYHYSAFDHALERRADVPPDAWSALVGGLPPGVVLVGLSSIPWRESWKYGERAFRYCQHDVGHAAAALGYAAGALGWSARLLPAVADDDLGALLGIAGQTGPEAEHPDALLALWPAGEDPDPAVVGGWQPPAAAVAALAGAPWSGTPSTLSPDHHPWPAIDDVAAAARHAGGAPSSPWRAPAEPAPPAPPAVPARRLFRTRRSAQAMDGRTGLDAATLYGLLARTLPRAGLVPHALWPWRPAVHLLLFVHRVQGIEPGLYLLCRDPEAREPLLGALSPDLSRERPAGTPDGLDLLLLERGDARRIARALSCQQEIASDGAFAVAMLAPLEPALRDRGPVAYRQLHWEAGAIGQQLYLEAEAAGLRGTGIGCFFDDEVHELVGLGVGTFQSLYHFTVGGPLDDPRLATLPAYHHRQVPTNSSHLRD